MMFDACCALPSRTATLLCRQAPVYRDYLSIGKLQHSIALVDRNLPDAHAYAAQIWLFLQLQNLKVSSFLLHVFRTP